MWLYVWSGEALLARVPYAPGWEPVTELALPDDTIRLRVEGELERLKGDCRKRRPPFGISRQGLQSAKLGDKNETTKFLGKLYELPGKADFQRPLGFIRTAGLRDAKAARQRGAEVRIARSLLPLEDVIRNYLPPRAKGRRWKKSTPCSN